MKSLFRYSFPGFLAVAVFVAIFLYTGPGFAHLLLAPKRVVFEGRSRSATIALLNTTNESKTYVIGWKALKIGEDGKVTQIPIDENDPYSMKKMVVFSPRRVTIEPNGRQSVRLSLRRPADLPPGEYRGHLTFSSDPGSSEEQNISQGKDKGFSLSLRIGMGMSIPVILRNGEAVPSDVTIEDVTLSYDEKIGKQKIDYALKHALGANSTFGVVSAYLGEDRIGNLPNVTLYPEQGKRQMHLVLNKVVPPGSTIRMTYTGSEEYSETIFAEKMIQVTK